MNALEIRGLSKSYKSLKGAENKSFELKNIDITLPSGYIMGLIGENGAGKSTIIRLIMDLIKRDSGSVKILGRDNKKDFAVTKEELGVVLDRPGFPECLDARRINKVLSLTYKNWHSDQFYDYLKKFEIPEDKQFGKYSQGMQMKLAIAAALSHDPKLLILDEATNGLDPVARDNVNDILMDFTRDESHSVLISSHIVSDLERLCDYIAFLHKGELMLCEEKDRLLEEFALIQCSKEDFERIPKSAVRGVKRSAYNVEAVAERAALPEGVRTRPVTIEELFVFMVKEGV